MRQILVSAVFFVLSLPIAAQSAQEWYDKAMQQVQEKQFTEALESCNKALMLNPDFAEAYNRRGYIYYQQKQYENTIADCSKALAIDPQLAKAYVNRGLAYYLQGNYTSALPDLRKVTALNEAIVKDNGFFYAAYGYAAYVNGNTEESMTALDKAITLAPNNGSYYASRGDCHYKLMQYDAAIADYSRAIEYNNPAVASNYYNRAGLYHLQKKYREAYTDYYKAFAVDPKIATKKDYSNYGYEAYFIKQYDQCIKIYDQAIANEPNNGSYHRVRGACKEELKLYQEAISDYSQAIKLGDTNITLWLGRGFCYYETKQFEKAIPDYNRYLKEYPQEHAAYNIRAICYHNMGNWPESLKDLDEAIRLNPSEITYINNRAYSHFMMGNYDKALNDYENCARMGGKDYMIYYYFWDKALLQYVQQPTANADIIYNNAMALLKRKPEGGLIKQAMDAAIAKFPNDGRFYLTKYIAMKQDVDFGAERIPSIEKAALLMPNDAAALYYLGMERFLQNKDNEAKSLFDKSMSLGGSYLIADNSRFLGNGNYKQVIINRETRAYERQQTPKNTIQPGMSNEAALREMGQGLMGKMQALGYRIEVSEYCSNVKSNVEQLNRQPRATLKYGDGIVIIVVSPEGADVRLLDSHNAPCTNPTKTGVEENVGGFNIKQCGKNNVFEDGSLVWYNIMSFNRAEFFYFLATYNGKN
jgi:tetratricopeptide (TPR) repeat protein